ncbi:hypothetical protein ACVWXN_006681 [Bradyrhizobium sp. i1.4.4]|uniref:hypothetical protein n=1 Tax=Bradyrhizobium sp. LA6.10 TaxID=3156318 RepID=UPI003390CD61
MPISLVCAAAGPATVSCALLWIAPPRAIDAERAAARRASTAVVSSQMLQHRVGVVGLIGSFGALAEANGILRGASGQRQAFAPARPILLDPQTLIGGPHHLAGHSRLFTFRPTRDPLTPVEAHGRA